MYLFSCVDDVSLWEWLLDWKRIHQVIVDTLFLEQSCEALFSPPLLPNFFFKCLSKGRDNTFQMQD